MYYIPAQMTSFSFQLIFEIVKDQVYLVVLYHLLQILIPVNQTTTEHGSDSSLS